MVASVAEQRVASAPPSPPAEIPAVQPVPSVVETSSSVGSVEPLIPLSGVELKLQLENTELHQLHAKLQDRLDHERRLAEKFRAQIETYRYVL